jgi:peroxisomal membrane protein 2
MRAYFIPYVIAIVSNLLTSSVQSFTSLRIQLLPTPQILNTITSTATQSRSTASFNQSKIHNQNSIQQDRTSNNRKSVVVGMTMSDAWDAYNHALEMHPLVVKSVTASIILGLGDFAGQAVQSLQSDTATTTSAATAKGIDYGRAARFAIFGLVLQAPWNHYYYLLLDGLIPPTIDEPFSTTNMIKVGIDQFIQAPIFTVLIFVFLGLLEGKAYDDIKKQLQNDYPETMVANCKFSIRIVHICSYAFVRVINFVVVLTRDHHSSRSGKLWIPATVINIGFIPPLFRVLYLNVVFFFWSIYLSLVLNREEIAVDIIDDE